MTTRIRKNKITTNDQFVAIYVSYTNRFVASFLGSVAQLGKKYIVEKDLFDKMMIWSFIEEKYGVPATKEFTKPTAAPYIRITKLYDNFKENCRRHRMEPCSFKIFRDEITKYLEVCFAQRGGHRAVYLVNTSETLYHKLSRTKNNYDFSVFSAPFPIELWHMFGKKIEKGPDTADIVYHIRGGLDVCVKKNFKIKEEGI